MTDTARDAHRVAPDQSDPVDRIPDFATEQEARDFWDTHDSAPYFHQTEDVTADPPAFLRGGPGREGSHGRRRPAAGRMDLVSIRIPAEMIDGIKAIAARRHLPYQTLMRAWIGERLGVERQALGADEHPGNDR